MNMIMQAPNAGFNQENIAIEWGIKSKNDCLSRPSIKILRILRR